MHAPTHKLKHTHSYTHTLKHTHTYTQTHNIPKAGKRLIKAVPVRRVACQWVRGAQFPGPPRVSRRGGRVEWWTWRCPACRRRCCPTPGRRTWHHWRWPGSPGSWCQTLPAAHCLWTRRWGWGDGGGGVSYHEQQWGRSLDSDLDRTALWKRCGKGRRHNNIGLPHLAAV